MSGLTNLRDGTDTAVLCLSRTKNPELGSQTAPSRENFAETLGGVAYVQGKATFERCKFRNNRAGCGGSDIFQAEGGKVSADNVDVGTVDECLAYGLGIPFGMVFCVLPLCLCCFAAGPGSAAANSSGAAIAPLRSTRSRNASQLAAYRVGDASRTTRNTTHTSLCDRATRALSAARTCRQHVHSRRAATSATASPQPNVAPLQPVAAPVARPLPRPPVDLAEATRRRFGSARPILAGRNTARRSRPSSRARSGRAPPSRGTRSLLVLGRLG